MKDNSRQNDHDKKHLEAEKHSFEREIDEKLKVIENLRNDQSLECSKGCEKYSKSVDEIYEAGVKHKSKLVELKEIADEQKS